MIKKFEWVEKVEKVDLFTEKFEKVKKDEKDEKDEKIWRIGLKRFEEIAKHFNGLQKISGLLATDCKRLQKFAKGRKSLLRVLLRFFVEVSCCWFFVNKKIFLGARRVV